MYKSTSRFNERYQISDYYGTNNSSLVDFSKPYIKEYIDNFRKQKYKILDVGGGQGRDSIALAKIVPNSEVYMLDLSDIGIQRANEKFALLGLKDRVFAYRQDIFVEYDEKFRNADMASACMSLMFHSDSTDADKLIEETEKIFKNVSDSLIQGGLLSFSGYSDKDGMASQGSPMGGYNELRLMPNGRFWHFFTKEYILNLLKKSSLDLVAIETVEEEYDPQMKGRMFHMYNVVARKL